jgi:HEPN domain-containing protein
MRSPAEVREALVRQWVESARDDLAWAEMRASAAELRGIAQIGFHAQQATEKVFNALLTAYGIQPEDQHSLSRLLEQIRRLDRRTADEVGNVASLTRYAVYHRYPPRVSGSAQPLSRSEVLQDLKKARDAFPIVLATIEARLTHSRESKDR